MSADKTVRQNFQVKDKKIYLFAILLMTFPAVLFAKPEPHRTNEVLYVKFKYSEQMTAPNIFASTLVTFKQKKLKTTVKFIAPVAMLHSTKMIDDGTTINYVTYFSNKYKIVGMAIFVAVKHENSIVFADFPTLVAVYKDDLTKTALEILTVASEAFAIEKIDIAHTFGAEAKFRF